MKSLLLGLLLAVVAQSTSWAQGFTPAADSLWMKVGYGYARASEDFSGVDDQLYEDVALGTRKPFRSRQGELVGGTLQIHEITFDAVWAPADGWVVGGFVPLFKAVRYENPRPFSTSANQPGDVVVFGGRRLTPGEFRDFGATAFVKAKVPTSFKFPYTNEALTGEGQFDVSGALAVTYAIASTLHLNASVEARYRFPFDGAGGYVEPGNELETSVSVGGSPVSGVWVSAGLNGLWATPFRVRPDGQTTTETKMERRFSTAMASVYWYGLGTLVGTPGLALDAWTKVPIAGVDYPVLYSGGLGVAMAY
ncbi:MAG: hypothetical protein R3E66_07920 [bacterium]